MPNISVVVPVYKVEPYLRRCVDSILSQTYTDFQLILIDDGSPDNCGKICDEYAKKDSRIHVIHRENGGLSAARNSGIDWVFDGFFTEWITFIDSDDWVVVDYLEKLLDAAMLHGDRIVIGGFQKTHDGNVGKEKAEVSSVVNRYSPEAFWVHDQGNATVAWGKLYKTELFEDVRYPKGKLHEDEFTTYKLLFAQKMITVLPAKLYLYFQSPNSIMRSKWSAMKIDSLAAYEEQMLFFKINGYKLAYRESEKLHTYKTISTIKEIKNGDNVKYNLSLMYDQIRKYLRKSYRLPLPSYVYVLYERIKLFVSVRYNVFFRVFSEHGLKGVIKYRAEKE